MFVYHPFDLKILINRFIFIRHTVIHKDIIILIQYQIHELCELPYGIIISGLDHIPVLDLVGRKLDLAVYLHQTRTAYQLFIHIKSDRILIIFFQHLDRAGCVFSCCGRRDRYVTVRL